MFPVGIRVELQDLKAIAHMNGRRGTVCETPDENIGRPELAGRISVSCMRVMYRVTQLPSPPRCLIHIILLYYAQYHASCTV